jgi:hypothetical protein
MKINSNWISGFVDGEGTFYVGINKNNSMTIGYQVLPEFRIVQHERDIELLRQIKKYFNCGVVRKNHDTRQELRIRSLVHLTHVVIPHFEKYPLISCKKFDFLKFKEIIELMNSKKHLSQAGLKKIIMIAAKMNRKNKFIANQIQFE